MNDAHIPEPGATPAPSDPAALFDPTTELGRALAAVDWAANPLGAVAQWPVSLKNTVRTMLASRFAMWMAWGPELIFFCNDDYRRDTLGAKFPWALGRPSAEVWSEVWDDVRDRVEAVVTDGISTWDEGLRLFLERSGYPEETYHTFSYSPLADDDGRISGLLCVVSEDTGRVVSERRMTTLRDLGAALSQAGTELEVSAAAQRALATDPYNLPFALAYLLDGSGEAAELAWTAGIEAGHPAAPARLDPADPAAPWIGAARADSGELVELADRWDDLPTGAWDGPPTQALVAPLRQPGVPQPYGFLVVGLNRHRPFDADYRGFLDLVADQIAAALTRARAFEAERTRAEQMAELDRAKTTFFTNVSHELRTPLTLLLGPAEDALADDNVSAAQRDRLEVIHRNGERLLKLVNTLLDFSRLESGRASASYEPIDLARYTGELAAMFESAFVRAGLTLTIDCPPLPEPVHVDREMWAKIVLNLLSNGLKATFTGGITVRLEVVDDAVELRVADTGVGIAAGELEHLFERFRRVEGAALRTHEGSGIGLALVAELVALHGGTVEVDSVVGAGTTFRVRVPRGAGHLPPERVVDTPRPDGIGAVEYSRGYLAEALRWVGPDAAPAPAEPDGADERRRVLVVDDNADMRDYIAGLLAPDYVVLTAPDGEAGLERARAEHPDLVLTDVMMPRLDGFGLLAALRAQPQTMHIPVVMLSARSGDEAAVEGLEAGADDYLVKPFSARELQARVRSNLELDRVRRLAVELARQQALLTRAEELAGVGSYELDLDTGELTGSAQFHALLGRDDQLMLQTEARRSVAAGLPLGSEFRVTGADGDERVVWATGAPDVDEDGAPTRILGSVQDITDRRRAELSRAAEQAARQAEEREHAIAVELQRSLLPASGFDADHLEVATFYRAGVEGTEVGGDWYDVIELDAGRTALVLGDVMGRGVRAAAVMGQLRATVRAYARLDIAPDLLLHLLDAAVREISADTIVTAVYAVYDPTERLLTYANAGHLPPLLTVPGAPARRLGAGGPPLGTGRAWSKPEQLVLEPGAVLTLYTDGLVEERGGDLDEGIDRLAALLSDEPEIAPDRLVAALRPDVPDDDIAVLVARVSDRSSADRYVAHRFEPDADIARQAREVSRRHLDEWSVSAEICDDVELIVSELVTNALRHGRPPIELRLRLAIDRLFVDVHDGAMASPRMRHAGPADDGGRGLLIVATLAERWGTRHTDEGKSVWCMMRLR